VSNTINSVEELLAVQNREIQVDSEKSPATPAQSDCKNERLDERPEVETPGTGRTLSEFATELGNIIGPKRCWFLRNDTVVEIRTMRLTQDVTSTVFHQLSASETRSTLEHHAKVGKYQVEKRGKYFVPQSIGQQTAQALLDAPQFKECLPAVERILDIPIPLIHDGELTFARKGYDERFRTYCPESAPDIKTMALDEAKQQLNVIFDDFCFVDEASKNMALARFITPFLRGIIGFGNRTPVWLFEANRPRAGKDYLAGCTTVFYEGCANEDAPIDHNAEETQKRIMAAAQSGRRMMHFANCKGNIDNKSFEHATTAKFIAGRLLGKNDASADLKVPNEIEFSLSANTGLTYTEDFAQRCRRISLGYYQEDANSRTFKQKDLHGWIRENRESILSALAALVRHWDGNGRPEGTTPFSSFPEWAAIVGGVMTCCGFGDPCASQKDGLTIDQNTADMKRLFSLALHTQELVTGSISKRELLAIIHDQEGELFPWFDPDNRSHQMKLSSTLKSFNGRQLGDITMRIDESASRPRFSFTEAELPSTGRESTSETTKCEPCRPLVPSSLVHVGGGVKSIGAGKVEKVHRFAVNESNPLPVHREKLPPNPTALANN
jgi:hypothetical protein